MLMTTVQAVSQREVALMRANFIRLGRADLRRQVKLGELDLRELIREPPDVLLTAKVFALLQWMPHVGPERARRALFGICGLTLPLGVTGGHTRRRIVEAIDDLHAGRR